MPATTKKKTDPKSKTKKTAEQPAVEVQLEAVISQDPLPLVSEQPISLEPPLAPKLKTEKKESSRPLVSPRTKERFDLNSVCLSGVIRSVWGNNADVFARLALSARGKLVEEDDAYSSYVTLRFAEGEVGGAPITIQLDDIINLRGFLTHREFTETIRKFLDDARSMSFFDQVDAADLSAWRSIVFRRQNAVVNVLSMSLLDRNGGTFAQFGQADPRMDVNRANVEGIVARKWDYPKGNGVDLFIRLAVYDEYTPLDAKHPEGNFGRPRRLAHYVTVRFPEGKTTSGSPVRLNQGMRIRVSGELRDKGQTVTLHAELLRTGNPVIAEMMQRVPNAERMSEIKNVQESLHILADAVIVYSASGGSRNK